MKYSLQKILSGYASFRKKYATGDQSVMQSLAMHGQKPEVMIVACCDSRVDPSLILQCHPGDLFIARNVANIIPPYECDEKHHGTSAALEFGVCYLEVKHLIILGHSQCGGIHALLHEDHLVQDDFISNWVSVIKTKKKYHHIDDCAKESLSLSYENCFTFPWIKSRVEQNKLIIHRWFFDIESGEIQVYFEEKKQFSPLSHSEINL